MRLPHVRRILPTIALIVGLMAMALSCGESLESPAMATDSRDGPLLGYMQESGGAQGPPGMPGPADADGAAGAMGERDRLTRQMGLGAAAEAPAAMPAAPAASIAQAQATPAPAQPSAVFDNEESATKGQSQSQQPQSGRQLIVEAWISLEVTEIDATVRHVEALAAQRGGWVESAEIFGEGGYRSASLRVRVPAGGMDNAMDALRGLGRVTDEGISATDVTDRLIDNAARLEAWYVQEERLIDLLGNAPTVEDIIQIERRISEVRSDIEHVEATQRNLTDRVATSLVTVNLNLPGRFAADPPNGALTLAVGDPSATADAVVGRVEGLNGYVGRKREYDEGRGQAVDLTVFVKPADLAGLIDYAATLGEPSGRRLDSVGPATVGEAPNARLTLAIRSNVDLSASLSLSSDEPVAVAEQIRERAESLGGYVESWNEIRRDEEDFITAEMELVVKSSDLRDLMEFGAGLGKTEYWGYEAVGQNPSDDAPNARLSVSVFTDYDDATDWIIGGVIAAVVVVAAAISVAVVLLVLRRRRRAAISNVVTLEPDSVV